MDWKHATGEMGESGFTCANFVGYGALVGFLMSYIIILPFKIWCITKMSQFVKEGEETLLQEVTGYDTAKGIELAQHSQTDFSAEQINTITPADDKVIDAVLHK